MAAVGSSSNGRQGTGHLATSQGSGEGRARALARKMERRQGMAMEARGGGGVGGLVDNGMNMTGFPPSPFL